MMKSSRIALSAALLSALLAASVSPAWAVQYSTTYDLYFMNIEEPEDTDDDNGLRFGGLLKKFLWYDKDLTRFTFNDNLYVMGDVAAVGTLSGASITATNLLDSSSAASGSILVSRESGTAEWKTPIGSMIWYIDGALTTGTNIGPTIVMPFAMTLSDVDLRVKDAPTGQAIIIDINENDTTVFSTRPQIVASATSEDDNQVFSDTELAAGSEVTIDIDQVGSTLSGTGLTIILKGTRHY